jgi:hypothetical protein
MKAYSENWRDVQNNCTSFLIVCSYRISYGIFIKNALGGIQEFELMAMNNKITLKKNDCTRFFVGVWTYSYENWCSFQIWQEGPRLVSTGLN